MTLNLNVSNLIKPFLYALLALATCVFFNYLAGYILLFGIGLDDGELTMFTFSRYWYYYGDHQQVAKWLPISALVALALMIAPVILFMRASRRSLFGEARFATMRDLRKSGLLNEKGIIVGKRGNKFLMFGGSQHAIISAPTRSGKGVGVVIPNLLSWPESIVVLDIKQENWDITSKYRQDHGQACFLFNPAASDYRTHCYNPLHYISENPNFRIDDIQKIASMLFPDQAGTDVIWTATPRGLFLGIVLYLLETPGKLITLGQVLRETLNDGDGSKYFDGIIRDRSKTDNPLSDICIRALNGYTSISSENTRAGVITSFRSRFELWMNPLVDAATSFNSFDLRKVRKEKMSIYLGVTPDNLDRMAPLLNLFFQQLLDLNTRSLPNQDAEIKHSCMLLMDEFTAIGKIGILSKGISYIAGYWLRMVPIIQSPAQLVEVYGKDAAQTFTTNHALNIIFPPKASETQTAKDVSEWLGYQTVTGRSESKGKGFFSSAKASSESLSDQRRALMLPQEITSLGQNKELIIMENVPPILADKILYFKDAVFMDRLKESSKSLRDLGLKIPTKDELDNAINSGELGAVVPMIDLEEHRKIVSSKNEPFVIKELETDTTVKTVNLVATVEDAHGIWKQKLENVNLAFPESGKWDVPAEGLLDVDRLNLYADQLCATAGIDAS